MAHVITGCGCKTSVASASTDLWRNTAYYVNSLGMRVEQEENAQRKKSLRVAIFVCKVYKYILKQSETFRLL